MKTAKNREEKNSFTLPKNKNFQEKVRGKKNDTRKLKRQKKKKFERTNLKLIKPGQNKT